MTSSRDNTMRKRKPRTRAPSTSFGRQVFIKKGLASFDLQDPYYFAVSLNWRRFGLLFLVVELSINLLFASLYAAQTGSIANAGPNAFLSAFFFSFETLATVGYGEMYPATTYAHVISSLEIVTGVVFTAIVTGLLFVRFSKPKAKIYYATNAVITQHNGKPTLMLRIGNARSTSLHDTKLSLHVLTHTQSTEGSRHALLLELPLLRSSVPVFAILYTIMHVIDEASPLFGLTLDSDSLDDMRFFFTLVGRDPAIGQEVSDAHSFDGADVRFGARYVDAVKLISSRKVVADYALLSEIVPDALATEQALNHEQILTVGG